MDTTEVLIIVLLLLMVVITLVSIGWAFYLDGKYRNRPFPKHYSVHVEGTKVFSEQDIAAAREEARTGLHDAVVESADMLRSMLAVSAKGIGLKASEMAAGMLRKEFDTYHSSLARHREEAIKQYASLQKELDLKRTHLLSEMDAAAKKVESDRIDSFNTRIGDVVSSYLVEALDNGVDLGVQTKYVLHTLEAHKEDIKKDILS